MSALALPNGWCFATIGELGSLINGDRGKNYPSKSVLVEEGIPFVNAGHLVNGCIHMAEMNYITEERYDMLGSGKIEQDDILYCLRGSLGKTAVVRTLNRGAIASSLVIVRCHSSVSRDFVYRFLVSPLGLKEIEKYDNGSAQPNLSSKSLAQYQLPLPPLPEQRRIVSKIEQLQEHSDAAKAALDAIPALLEQFRQSVLAAAFRGDLTKTWRLSAQAAGRQRAQTSELEALPKAEADTYFIYIIQCEDDSYYVGYTTSLQDRWRAHCAGEGADWTRTHKPKYLVHWESFDTQADALKREKDLKTGFGRTWRKREINAGRIKTLVHNPDLKTALPVHDTGMQTGTVLLDRIRAERKARFIESTAQTATEKAKTKFIAKFKDLPAHEVQARWPPDLHAKTLAKETAKATKKYKAPEPVDDAELPELPEGWCWATAEELAWEITVGHVGPMKDRYVSEGVPFLRSQNVRENRFDPKGLLYIDSTFHNELAKSKIRPGDVLVVRSGAPGTACVLPEGFGEANCADLVITRLLPGYVPRLCAFYINSNYAKSQVRAEQVGVAQQHFNVGSMKKMAIPIMPLAEQDVLLRTVAEYIRTIEQLSELIAKKTASLATLNQSILAKAFRGELVDQDPNDEPATDLLARIRQQREAEAASKPKRRRSASK